MKHYSLPEMDLRRIAIIIALLLIAASIDAPLLYVAIAGLIGFILGYATDSFTTS